MQKEYYYVYCQGVLGVKTNLCDFKWAYGSVAPSVSSSEYDKCVVKFDVAVKPEKHLNKQYACDRRFQAYSWDANKQTVTYNRKLFKKMDLGYRLQISDHSVNAEIGENYFKYVKSRVMNMHGVYYLLSDLANILLLKNGYLTLYASSVYMESFKKCLVSFAPPNTGKTCMASVLCERYGGALVGEDIVIFDGSKAHVCPWTNSYRKSGKSILDSSGSLGRKKRTVGNVATKACTVTDLAVLSLGEKMIDTDKKRILREMSILNGYLFHYYSSPIVKIISYFHEEFDKPWAEYAMEFFETMVENCRCYKIQSEESVDFAEIFYEIVSDKKV